MNVSCGPISSSPAPPIGIENLSPQRLLSTAWRYRSSKAAQASSENGNTRLSFWGLWVNEHMKVITKNNLETSGNSMIAKVNSRVWQLRKYHQRSKIFQLIGTGRLFIAVHLHAIPHFRVHCHALPHLRFAYKQCSASVSLLQFLLQIASIFQKP